MGLSNFLDDIKSGKFNLIFYFIFFLFIFDVYNKLTSCSKITEKMADTSTDAQIAEAVKKYYLSDEFIKNISIVSAQIQQNGLKVPGNLEVTGSFNLLPRGTIVAFNSNTAPVGWALCDGANGTPDLRGKFILSSGQGSGLTNRTIGQLGGAEAHVLSVNEMPSHTHNVNDWADSNTANKAHNNVYHRNAYYTREQNQSGGPEDRNSLFDSTSAATGGNTAHNNMPPFFVLAYIMKL